MYVYMNALFNTECYGAECHCHLTLGEDLCHPDVRPSDPPTGDAPSAAAGCMPLPPRELETASALCRYVDRTTSKVGFL